MRMKDVKIDKENLRYLIKVKDLKDKRRYNHTDNRTKVIDGFPHVYPVGTTPKQVYICCPYCKKIHVHGRVEGHRVAHCRDIEAEKINRNGYYIVGIEKECN